LYVYHVGYPIHRDLEENCGTEGDAESRVLRAKGTPRSQCRCPPPPGAEKGWFCCRNLR
jgi:hypothetical protein